MSKRLPIKAATMRKLFLNSGGRCAVEGCPTPLLDPAGGWGGTVAHIVGAEKDGPRGDSDLSAEARRGYDNLILCCAYHGRTIDDPHSGEKSYPVEHLRKMKERHESRVNEAVNQAIEGEKAGAQMAPQALDVSPNPSVHAEHAEPFAASTGDTSKEVVSKLKEIQNELTSLSRPALETLAKLFAVWQLSIKEGDTFNFGDRTPELPASRVENRVIGGRRDAFESALDELRGRGLVELHPDEYEGVLYYRFPLSAAHTYGSFWASAAFFLYEAHGILLDSWIPGLDFSIFDRDPAASRNVPWRDA